MASTKDRYSATGIDGCKLRYLKLRCKAERETIEFYQTLGMVYEGKIEFGKLHTALRFSFRTANAEFNEHSISLLFEIRKVRTWWRFYYSQRHAFHH
jgi:hypothetical protein